MFTLCLKKIQRMKDLNGGLEKINYVDFLGVKTFLSTFPKQNLNVGVSMVEEIGLNNFKYSTQSMPMMNSVPFIGRCCFVLVLRMGEWNELTGHPKDHERTGGIRGRILSSLGRMMQIGGPTAEDRPNGDLAVRTHSRLCFISLSIFCYFIRFRVLGYKYILIASKKSSC